MVDNQFGHNGINNKIDIKVGFACNNRCKFCVQGNKRKSNRNKNTEEIKKILKKTISSCSQIVFTGGEPTLRNDIVELVSFADSLGFERIQIQSNGRMFVYKDFCARIIEAGANEFSPAVHGPHERIHDYLTSSTGSFKQTIEGIKNLKALGQCVITNTVITTFNYKSLPEIAKLLVSLDVDQFQFAFPHISGTAYKNRNWLIPKKSEIMEYVKKGLDIGIEAGKKVMTEAIPFCFMQGYEDYIAEKIIPETIIFDANFVINNYTDYRKKKGKAKGPNCKRCKYDNICEGPWKEYPEIFGWDEFKPVSDI